MTKYKTNIHNIDAVILWVNGNDDKHKIKISNYVDNKSEISLTKFRTRFDQVNEIKFTIDSILKFAPYIENIHIITDEQTPEFLEKIDNNDYYKKVSIVDHKVVFKDFEQFLPTFNCRPIETCMHRIPGLAEHFIYFNDDFFLIKHTKPTDFFRNGLPVLRGKWLKFDKDIFYKKFKKIRVGHKKAQQKAAQLVGLKKYYNFKHTPHPLRKSTFKTYFNNNPNIFIENIKYRFRNKNQFTPQGLANHIEIKNKSCVLISDLELLYMRSYTKPLFWIKFIFLLNGNKKRFLGLQSLDQCPSKTLKFLSKWIENRLK
jgi:DNA-binding XRE family transcriptional regulator